MTTEIQELSEKLSEIYGVDADNEQPIGIYYHKWLAEDSGRISDLCDENGVDIKFYDAAGLVVAGEYITNNRELYANHPTKSAAARMARVRCLLAIGEGK